MESTFRKSLSHLLNFKNGGCKKIYRVYYEINQMGLIPELTRGSSMYLGVYTDSVDIWSRHSDYFIRYNYGDTTLEEHRGSETSFVCLKHFFENLERPCAGEIEILDITHPWIFPAISTMSAAISYFTVWRYRCHH